MRVTEAKKYIFFWEQKTYILLLPKICNGTNLLGETIQQTIIYKTVDFLNPM